MSPEARRAALPLDVSRETLDRLIELEALALRWTQTVNLVAPSTLTDFWRRHIVDGAQLWPVAGMDGAVGRWADLGAGGGFPGLVVAALAAEFAPGLEVALVESDARKCAFLADSARRLGLRPRILRRRIEAPAPEQAQIVSARALAPLPKLLGLARPWLAPGGRLLALKGAGVEAEIEAARRQWRFTPIRRRSITDDDGVILEIAEPDLAPS